MFSFFKKRARGIIKGWWFAGKPVEVTGWSGKGARAWSFDWFTNNEEWGVTALVPTCRWQRHFVLTPGEWRGEWLVNIEHVCTARDIYTSWRCWSVDVGTIFKFCFRWIGSCNLLNVFSKVKYTNVLILGKCLKKIQKKKKNSKSTTWGNELSEAGFLLFSTTIVRLF